MTFSETLDSGRHSRWLRERDAQDRPHDRDLDTISVDPTRPVTVEFRLNAETRGVGDFEISASALDSLGFEIGEPIFQGLPTGVMVMADLENGIGEGGIFVGAPGQIPLPPSAWALIASLGAMWWLGCGWRRSHCDGEHLQAA